MAIKRSEESLEALPDIWKMKRMSQELDQEYKELCRLIDEAVSLRNAEKRLDEIKKRIAQIVRDQGLISNDGKLWGCRSGSAAVVVREQAGRKTLSREKLIEAGVTPAQIEASYIQGANYDVVEIVSD